MALGTIPFTITDTAGVPRNGGTNASLRFPIAVPLRVDENKTSTSTFRVIDTTNSSVVPAAFRVGSRWGDVGNAGHKIRVVWVDLMPSLNANETRVFQLQTTGGTGSSTSGITVTTQAAYYEVNTGTAGITARVARTGAMTPLIYVHLNAIAGTGGDVINEATSTAHGGLWMAGIAGAGPSGSLTNNQGMDFFSNLDSTSDSSSNGGQPDETSRPQRYHTSIAFQNSQRVRIKIDTIRCKNTSNVEFRGMNREITAFSNTAVAQVATWDVYLDFFRNSTAIRRVYVFKSTGGDFDLSPALRSDCAIDGMGDDIALAYTGALQMATRDETATLKVARATSATAGTIRQLNAPQANGPYNFTLPRTGPITFTGTPLTQTEAFFDMTAADGSRGLLRIPWNWRNKFPMGWRYTPASGLLRWEMLNPDETEFGPTRAYHVILGHQWYHAEEWLVPHVGTLTDTQITDLVRALGGRHEVKVSGAWQDATQTGPGAQQTSLLGRCDADHWSDTQAWKRLPPVTLSRPDLLGTPGLLGLPGLLPGSTSKIGDALTRLNQWMDTYHDQAASANGISYRSHQAVCNLNVLGPLGHRYYGGHPTSGSGTGCGPNDYEQASYPIYHWLRRNDRGDFAIALESTLHCVTVDQFHNFFGNDTGGSTHGRLSDLGAGQAFHTNADTLGVEYQQNFEAPSLLYMLTGEEIFLEALSHYLNFFNQNFYGEGANPRLNARSRGGMTSATVSGNDLIVADVTGFAARPSPTGRSPVTAFPVVAYPAAGGGTVSSASDMLIFTSNLPGYAPGGAFRTPEFNDYNLTFEKYVGAVIRAPRTTGAEYKVLNVEPFNTTYTGSAQGVNGTNAVFQYTASAVNATDQLSIVIRNINNTFTAKTLNTHYTVSNMGPSGATITFTAGNIPLAETQVRMWDARRRLKVTPAPSPALSGVTWEWLHHTGQITFGGNITGIVGNTLQCTWSPGSVPTNGSTVTVWSAPVLFSRMEGWQLAALIGFAKCVGQFHTNEQGTHDLYARIKDAALHMLFTEQLYSHPDAITQMGGCGTFGAPGGGDMLPGAPGLHGQQNHTYYVYPTQPILYAHEFGERLAAAGFGAIFTPTWLSQMIQLLRRICQHGAMGVDDLSPIKGSQWNTLRRLPIGRGLDLASASSFQAWQSPAKWTYSEESTRTTRSKMDFFRSAADMNDLSTFGALFTNTQLQGGNGNSLGYFLPDALAYVAEKLWNGTNTAKRDLWLKQAMEMGTSALCFGAENHPTFGAYINPATYPGVSSIIASNGAVFGGIRAKHWAAKHHGYWMTLAKTGFGTVTPDTTAPTETQLLAEVSKTHNQITVDGPAATDNVGVVDYQFFLNGTLVDTVPTTSYTYLLLSPSTTYSLKRRARDAVLNVSGDSNTLSIQTFADVDDDPPTTPVIATPRTVTSTSITYTWPASTDATGVLRYLFSFDGGADVEIPHPGLTHVATDLTPGSTHTGKVRAEDTQGNISIYSTQVSDQTPTVDTEAPSTPGPAILVSRTSTSLTVDFAPSTDDVGVVSYGATAEGGGAASASAPPITIPDLEPFTEYSVTQTATDAAENVSDPSPAVLLTTLRLARQFLATSGQVVRATVLPAISDYPLTVGIKVYPTLSANGFIWSMANHLVNTDSLFIKTAVISGILRAHASRTSGASGLGIGTSSTGVLQLNVWQRIIAVFASSTLVTVRLSGDPTAVSDASLVTFPTGLSRLTIGGLDRLAPVQWYTGRAADHAIWTAALDDVEQTAYLSGVLPWLIRRNSLVSHHLLHGESPELDLVGSSDFTVVGATTGDGPEDVASLTDPTPEEEPGEPGLVTNIVITAVGANSISFAWDAADNAALYRIRRGDQAVVFEKGEGDRTFTAEGLLPFTSYTFTIAAVNAATQPIEGALTAFTETTKPVHSTAAVGRQARSVITPRD